MQKSLICQSKLLSSDHNRFKGQAGVPYIIDDIVTSYTSSACFIVLGRVKDVSGPISTQFSVKVQSLFSKVRKTFVRVNCTLRLFVDTGSADTSQDMMLEVCKGVVI